MSNAEFKIVYYGEKSAGFTDEETRQFIVQLFNTSEGKAREILNSRMAVLKKHLDKKKAASYQHVLGKAGLKVVIEPMGKPSESVKPVQKHISPNSQQISKSKRPAFTPTAFGHTPPSDEIAWIRAHHTQMPFEFYGTGTEYFKIWIVNIILSVLTLGIYSAWAKVRRKQYFYGNTRVYGSSFQYLADPLKILKGRIIVFGCVAAYALIYTIYPIVSIFVSTGLVVILPWIVVRSLAFNARNSALRNIRFGFKARIWDAAKVFVLWPALGALTFGLLMPFVYCKQKKFVVEHSRYGITKFKFNATAIDYYWIFLVMTPVLLTGIVLVVIVGFLFAPVVPLFTLPLVLYCTAFFTVKSSNLLYNSSKLNGHGFRADMGVAKYIFMMVTNSIAIALTLGLYHPWAQVRVLKYKTDHLKLVPGGDLEAFIASEEEQVSAFGDEMSDFMDFDFGL